MPLRCHLVEQVLLASRSPTPLSVRSESKHPHHTVDMMPRLRVRDEVNVLQLDPLHRPNLTCWALEPFTMEVGDGGNVPDLEPNG
ncbi:hypothetical protein ADL03_21210 [Nocardia sp. NRRL S-836]|nr:hypothetical protein ADL03_21210 [Nocardia sp. NRRL S-836]